MTFRLTASAAKAKGTRGRLLLRALAVGALLCTSLTVQSPAQAQTPMAVIPTRTIYPGETIQSDQVQAVEVTNPNLTGDYASAVSQVTGKITSRTLLARPCHSDVGSSRPLRRRARARPFASFSTMVR